MYQSNNKVVFHKPIVEIFRCYSFKLGQLKIPSWVALIGVAFLALALSGCITARQPYGLDKSAMVAPHPKMAQSADPIITSSLPASGGWSPQFYPGTGVKPGAVEPQSAPFTPKGIKSTAGMPPKPHVTPVDLPAPPLPLPESTIAPSSSLFGRSSVGRAASFNNRGLNFAGTALGQAPRFNQPLVQNSLKVFPNTTQPAPNSFRIASNNSGRLPAPSARALPFPQLQQQRIGLPKTGDNNMRQVHQIMSQAPAHNLHMQKVNTPAPPPPSPLVPNTLNNKLNIYNQSDQLQPPSPGLTSPRYGPTFQMSKNMAAYNKRPVPRGSNLVVSSNGYQVDTGDELNIRVLGETDLTGKYLVDSTGSITMPMISTVNVRGRTVSQISNMIQNRLRQGFLRTPSVSVEVITSRPFYILGQVKKPGKYNFVNGLTVSQAIAIAGGYEPRARKGMVQVTRHTAQGPITAEVPNEEPLMPGDTIYIKQRWF